MESTKPVKKFRAGAVSCALWENQIQVNGEKQKILKATVSRRYKDRDGIWKTSQSFSRSEIPLAIFVLFQAFETMVNGTAEDEILEAVEEQVV